MDHMIDKAIYNHLVSCSELAEQLTDYAGKPAVFNQEIPVDVDDCWNRNAQYPRVVFALDISGDAARAMGGTLLIDMQCKNGEQLPEETEPIIRHLIDGCFFSNGQCTMAAQWVDSRPFTDITEQICGITLTFSLLAFPVITTYHPDVVQRINAWTAENFPDLLVIHYDKLPDTWKPDHQKSAVYWHADSVQPAGWIPDTHRTIWRTALIHGHVFSSNIETAALLSQQIIDRLDSTRRLVKTGESQIIVNRRNSIDNSADALRTGQITVEATFGQIIFPEAAERLNHIHYV